MNPEKHIFKGMLLASLFLSSIFYGSAQTDFDLSKKSVIDTSNVVSYREHLILRTFIMRKFNEVIINDLEHKNDYKLRPNSNRVFGLGFNYKWLGLNVGVSPGFLNRDDHRYGKTKSFGFTSNIYRPHGGFDVAFQLYRGYYLHNADDYMKLNNDEHPLSEHLSTIAIGFSGFHTFNPDFSYRSAFTQQEWQKETAGSWIVGGYFTIIGNSSSEDRSWLDSIPNIQRSPAVDLVEASVLSFGVTIGYVQTWRIKDNWFITTEFSILSGLKGASARLEKSELILKDGGLNVFELNTKTRIGLGYDNQKYLLGLFFFNRNFSLLQTEDIRLRMRTSIVRFVYAIRLDTSGWYK